MMINVLLKTMKTMKKYSILLSATLAILALASCQKEQEIVNEETPNAEVIDNTPTSVPFVLRADIPSVNSEEPSGPETKTTLNTSTWAVEWESTDVIYAVTTDKAWGKDYADDKSGDTIAEFAYDSEKGTFSTDMAIADGSHTFNFLYTAGQQKSFHRGASTTFSLAGTQTFDASTPTASLKIYDALAAQVKATTPTTFADVDMSHLFTLMKVTLKNKTGASVNISKFEVEIPGENLYGIFDVTFGTTPSAAYNRNGGDKITINISNGAVASGASLDVYFVMGAVSGYTGEVTFTVTDSASNTYTKTNTISGTGVTFAAGTYNTASYTLKTADPIEYVTLDWDYAGGTASELEAVPGVTTSGLGGDYAASHAPYRVKFDGTGDYIQVRTDAAIGTVSVGYKMIGGANTSYLNIFESADGSDWGERIDRLTISGTQNSIGTVTTTATFNAASRFVKIVFERGHNVGIGTISIHKANTDPIIQASDIANVPAAGVKDESWTYIVKNFVDDVEVAEVTGCVTEAIADGGSILYSVAPNYTTTAKDGTIVLWSAANHSVTTTISVAQLKSTLTVSELTVTIPANATTTTFTVTSAEFGYNAVVASTEAGMNLSISNGATGSASASAQTVTVSSTTEAPTSGDPITLGTINVYRNGNASDSQLKTLTILKAVDSGSGGTDYYTRVSELDGISVGDVILIINESHNAFPAYTSSATISATSISSEYDSVNDRFSASTDVNACAITVESPYTTKDNTYKLKMSNNKYIAKSGSGTSLSAAVETPSSTSVDWTLSIVSGHFRATSVGANTRCLIWRAGSQNKFGAYAKSNVDNSEYYDIYIYKLSN